MSPCQPAGSSSTLTAPGTGLDPSNRPGVNRLGSTRFARALDGARTPGEGEPGGDGGPVLAQACGVVPYFLDGAGLGQLGPFGELAALAVGEDVGELADQGAGRVQLGAAGGNGGQRVAVLVGELAGRGPDPVRDLLRRWRRRLRRGAASVAEGGGVAAQGSQAAAVAAAAEFLVELLGAVTAFFPPLMQVGQVRVQEAGPRGRDAGVKAAGVGGGGRSCGPGPGRG
jgi:hypothetical protein